MIHNLLDLYHNLTNPDQLVRMLNTLLSGWVGYAVLFGVIFSETGLLVGFFLPGDSFLFTIGVVTGAGALNFATVNVVLIVAAMAGDSTGYFLGRQSGPKIFNRPDSLLFKQAYVKRTKEYYDRYGGKTILIARFVPIVRTFAAFMAGVGQMPYLRFLPFSICGGIGWVLMMTTLGFSLGRVPLVRQNFDKAILLIIFLSLVPTFIEIYKARRHRQS